MFLMTSATFKIKVKRCTKFFLWLGKALECKFISFPFCFWIFCISRWNHICCGEKPDLAQIQFFIQSLHSADNMNPFEDFLLMFSTILKMESTFREIIDPERIRKICFVVSASKYMECDSIHSSNISWPKLYMGTFLL